MSFICVIIEAGGQGIEQGFKMWVDGGHLLGACNYQVLEAAVCHKQGCCLRCCLLGGLISYGFGGMIQKWGENTFEDDLTGWAEWEIPGALLCWTHCCWINMPSNFSPVPCRCHQWQTDSSRGEFGVEEYIRLWLCCLHKDQATKVHVGSYPPWIYSCERNVVCTIGGSCIFLIRLLFCSRANPMPRTMYMQCEWPGTWTPAHSKE